MLVDSARDADKQYSIQEGKDALHVYTPWYKMWCMSDKDNDTEYLIMKEGDRLNVYKVHGD